MRRAAIRLGEPSAAEAESRPVQIPHPIFPLGRLRESPRQHSSREPV